MKIFCHHFKYIKGNKLLTERIININDHKLYPPETDRMKKKGKYCSGLDI